MLKQILILCLLLGGVWNVQAQNIKEKIADEVCDCLQEAEIDESPQAVESALTTCMQTSVIQHLSEIAEELEIDMSEFSEEVGYELGKEIGVLLANRCKTFLEMMMRAEGGDEEAAQREKPSTVSQVGYLRDQGKSKDSPVFMTFEDETKTQQQLMLFTYFEGAEDLVSDFSKYEDKKVKVEWRETKVYDGKGKSFRLVKEIVALRLME
jgi:predicted hydrocarbon binding protein